MQKLLRSLSLCMALLLFFQLLIPFSALAEGTSAPTLTLNSEGKYTVSSVADLNTLRSDIDNGIDYSGKVIILTQDIDFSQATVALNSFTTQNTFNGCFDGKSHTISGYTDAKSGLFSLIDSSGYVRNLKLEANVVISDHSAIIADVITKTSKPYGLIANESAGTISRCSTTGTVRNDVVCRVAGIAGFSILKKKVDGKTSTLKGKLLNCFSNVVFNSQAASLGSQPALSGISYQAGDIIEHCYFYGQLTGDDTFDESNSAYPIKNSGGTAITCAYDSEVLGFSKNDDDKGIAYTTAEMKDQATYTGTASVLGFDFDKCWSIDPAINNGYPYLDPLKEDKEVVVKISVDVDIQVNVADKTYDSSLSEVENRQAVVTNVQIANPTPEMAALIAEYNVQVDYAVNKATLSGRMGEWPVTVAFDKLELTYDPNDAYEFTINSVLPTTAKYLENGQPGPTEAEQAKQIESAKKAQDIIYNTYIEQVELPPFTWGGDKATAPGQEGSIVWDSITLSQDTWMVFSAARFGYTGVSPGHYDKWFQSVQTGLQNMKAAGIEAQDVMMTEWDKLVLAITAIGYDPRDIKAYDLIDIISNQDYVSASTRDFAKQYAVFALDSYNYTIPTDGNRVDKDTLINNWAAELINNSPDLTDSNYVRAYDREIMKIQPLFAYYNPNAQAGDPYYDVKVAVERLLAKYSAAQTDIGYFYSGMYKGDNDHGDSNEWNNAQVYISLGMIPVNPFDARFIKNGYSIFNGALANYDFENGTVSINYEPGQLGRGLDSLVRAYEGRNNIFDCTDVLDSTVLVNNAIAALPATITSANKTEVEAAQALYNALSDAKKASLQDTAKAKLAAAQLAIGGESDTTPPVITVKNLTDQTLSEDLTVSEPSFSFKVTAQDAKDGTISPSVQLNGTALTAGTDGSYTCTLITGSNTITVTATDAKGNKAEQSLKVELSNTNSPDITTEINGLQTWIKNYVKSVFDQTAAGGIVSPSEYNWPTIGLARLGNDDGLDIYLEENRKYLANEENWAELKSGVKATEFERMCLAIGAANGDPRNIAGKDLIAEIYNFPAVTPNGYPQFAQGTNGAIFALIALDSKKYELPTEAVWSRDKLITAILNNQMTDGGFALSKTASGATSDPDLTAMAIQALAPYQADTTKPEVKTALDKAIDYLGLSQQADGGYASATSESTSQAIIALCSVGIDINQDPRFIKTTNTLLSNLLSYRSQDGGIQHVKNAASNSMASEQALLAFTSYVRFNANQSILYDYGTESESAKTVADKITSVSPPVAGTTTLSMPTVPAGFTIVIKTSSNPGVLATDGKITAPDEATTVELVFTVTKTADGSTADTKTLSVTVPKGNSGGGDTSPPAITVKGSADQTLGENLMVTESSFSFKVTAQDEKDGALSPSVQHNSTVLTAGTDGSYTCTLSTGSNTITITATDAAGNKAEKKLTVTLSTAAFIIERVGNESFKNGQEARLKVKVSNQSAVAQEAILIVTLYKTDGGSNLVNYSYIGKTIRGDEQEELCAGFPVPESGTYTIKGFVWDDVEGMQALMEEPVIVDVAQS